MRLFFYLLNVGIACLCCFYGLWQVYVLVQFSMPVEVTAQKFGQLESKPGWVRLVQCSFGVKHSVSYVGPDTRHKQSVLIGIGVEGDPQTAVAALLVTDAERVKLISDLRENKRKDARHLLDQLWSDHTVDGVVLDVDQRDSRLQKLVGSLPIIEEGKKPASLTSSFVFFTIGAVWLALVVFVWRREFKEWKRQQSGIESIRGEGIEWIDLSTLVTAISAIRKSSVGLWGFTYGAAMTGIVLLSAGVTPWICISTGVGLAIVPTYGLLMVHRRNLLASERVFLLCVLLLAMGGVFIFVATILGGNVEVDAIIGMAVFLSLLFAIGSEFFKGWQAARLMRQSSLGNWHEKARQSRRSMLHLLNKPTHQAIAIRRLGWFSMGVAWLTLALSFVPLFSVKDYRGILDTPIESQVALYLCGGCFVLGSALIRWAARKSAPTAHEAIDAGSSPPVLYLRSFQDDDARIEFPYLSQDQMRWGFRESFVPLKGIRFEEFLVDELNRIGPVVAIGQPGEPIPQLGAMRGYFEETEWRDVIRKWMTESQLIVMVVGRTEGVTWEFEEISSLGLESKLVLVFPPDIPDHRMERWQAFQSLCPVPGPLANLTGESLILIRFRKSQPPLVLGCAHENSEAFHAALTIAVARDDSHR